MIRLARWVQGVRMHCDKCGKVQEGMIIVHNDDQTGLTVGLTVECTGCHKTLATWGET